MNYNVQLALPFTDDGRDLSLIGPEDIAEYSANQVRIVLGQFRGQYVFDTTAGVRWFELYEGNVPRAVVREAIREALLEQCEFVVRVEAVESNYDACERALSVAYTLRLVDGSTLTGEELL